MGMEKWSASQVIRTLKQLVRYGVVGISANAIGFALYLALSWQGIGHKSAMTILFAVGVAQTFVFNRGWSFADDGPRGPTLARYCTAYGLCYLVNLLGLYVLVDKFGYPHQVVQGIAIVSLAAVLFIAQKYWVFGSQKH